jgi:hypothetical protein
VVGKLDCSLAADLGKQWKTWIPNDTNIKHFMYFPVFEKLVAS